MQCRALPGLTRALGVDRAAGPAYRRYGATGILRLHTKAV